MHRYAHITHPGLARQHNEDNYLINEDAGLWVVADGMGGHACGEVASDIASKTIGKAVGDTLTKASNVSVVLIW